MEIIQKHFRIEAHIKTNILTSRKHTVGPGCFITFFHVKAMLHAKHMGEGYPAGWLPCVFSVVNKSDYWLFKL